MPVGPGSSRFRPLRSASSFWSNRLSRACDRAGPRRKEQHLIMTESVPPHPFDDIEALAWLRSQPEGHVTFSAAELGRQWGWNRMRTSRRLKAWKRGGLFSRNAEAIIVTRTVTPTVTDDTAGVTDAAGVTGMSGAEKAHRSPTRVKLAALIVALARWPVYRLPFPSTA